MDTMNLSTNETDTSSISGGSFNGLFFKLLLFLLSSSVFWVAISLAVLIHFIFQYVSRAAKHESGPKFYPEIENSCDKDRFSGLDYIWEHDHEAFWNSNVENYRVNDIQHTKELPKVNFIPGGKCDSPKDSEKITSGLSFKFEHQTPEEFQEPKVYPVKENESPVFNKSPISNKPQISNESPVTTNIQKYQTVPERNLRGFVQQPEIMTISINDIYTELKAKKIAIKEEKLNINLEEDMVTELEPVIEPEPISDVMPNPERKFELRAESETQPETEVETKQNNELLPDLKPEFEPAQAVKHEPESKSESEVELEREPEPEPESESESEPKPEQEPAPKPEQEPAPAPAPAPEPSYSIKSDAEVKSQKDLNEGSGRDSWSESKSEYTNYIDTEKATILGPNSVYSIDDVTTESVQISDRGSFYPVNEPAESEYIPSDAEIPLEKPKRLSNKPNHGQDRRKLVRRKRSKKEKPLEKPKLSSSSSTPSTVSSKRGRRTRRRRFVSEEFSSFDSDSKSSVSDGYSVKDLVMDSDSDWFLSEKESDNSKHKTYTAEESTNVVRYTSKLMDHIKELEKSQEKSFYSSEIDSSKSLVQISYDHHQPNEVDAWLETSSKVEYDEQNEEGNAETVVAIESEVNKFRETDNLKETNMESDSSLYKIVITNEDLNKETQTATLSQEDFATCENLDRETHTDTLNQQETISPRKDTATGEQTQDTDDIDRQKRESKDKGKEYLDEWDEEDEDELESLWEHQDLIEQLKMEIKKAKAIGLPTILEESESPRTTIEDLKPWHFDEKFLREDPMDELNKFYKSYRERMRKFDILNYQKMYAVGFLQLKNPLESMGSQKPLLPTITSILSQNLYRRRKSSDDPSERFIRELRCDLEMVYVGQMCLSWEFLRWQYEKTREMPESDAYRSHRYNQAAGEFQQFQVLVNRFVENEPFQGPRLPNYVKNRCVLRNLLQVPVVKEDSMKEKLEDDRKGNYIVTSEDLEDIMEESIRVFWEFVKADKDETPVLLKGLVGPQVELQDPADYDFMMHLHSILQKKEKRLKDHLKTGNCLVKKFKKPKEDRSNQDLFFSQVDLKLVSRVLKMPKITSEQLQWCHKKLDKISFVDRKIQREPAFLLFPC